MNAYELADALQELDSRLHLIDLFKSANMLRQQADRIAELEKELAFMEGDYPEPTIVEKMKEYEKQSEPVGLFKLKEDHHGSYYIQALPTEDNHNLIPLYTTPQTKPLSDDEIEEVIKTFQLNSLMKNLNYKDFVRAVEERIKNGK